MAIPKSKKLAAEEAQKPEPHISIRPVLEQQQEDSIAVREIQCCNDFVAILQSQIKTNIAMADNESSYKNEGLVVGVGPGVADGNGGRLQPCVSVGDSVMFGARNIVATVESQSEPYIGKKIVIVSERNIICKLPKQIPHHMVE